MRIVLRSRVRADETYVNDSDFSKDDGQTKKRCLSKQSICIAVGIDARKEPVTVVCEHGNPSSLRIETAMRGISPRVRPSPATASGRTARW